MLPLAFWGLHVAGKRDICWQTFLPLGHSPPDKSHLSLSTSPRAPSVQGRSAQLQCEALWLITVISASGGWERLPGPSAQTREAVCFPLTHKAKKKNGDKSLTRYSVFHFMSASCSPAITHIKPALKPDCCGMWVQTARALSSFPVRDRVDAATVWASSFPGLGLLGTAGDPWAGREGAWQHEGPWGSPSPGYFGMSSRMGEA